MQQVKCAALLVIAAVAGGSIEVVASSQRGADRAALSPTVQNGPIIMPPPAFRARKDPFKRLFESPVTQVPARQAPVQIKPKIVCGTVLVPGDASVDPKMARPKPLGSTRFTIRGVEPPACRPQ